MKRVAKILLTAVLMGQAMSAYANAFYDKAKTYADEGKTKEAVIELRNSLQEDADHVESRLLLGQLYLDSNNFLAAEKELARAKELGADKDDWVMPLGRVFLLLNQKERLLEELVVANNDADSVKADVLALRGTADMDLGEVDRGLEQIRRALSLDSNHPFANSVMARYQMRERDFAQANRYIDKALVNGSNDDQVWQTKAEIAGAQNNIEEARSALNKAIELRSENFIARMMRASVLLNEKELDAAGADIAVLEKVIPQHPTLSLLKGKKLLLEGNVTDATPELQAAQSRMPQNPEANMLLGFANVLQKNWQQAETMLTNVTRIMPDHVPAKVLLARLYTTGIKKPDQAIALLEPEIEKNPEDVNLLVQLSNAYMAKQDYDAATEAMERALEIDPEANRLRTGLALLQLQTGDTDDAILQLESAADDSDQLVAADLMLVMTHLRNKDMDKAESMANELASQHADNPLALNTLGVVYLAKKDDELAETWFKKALDANENFATAWTNLARLEMRRENYDQALEYLQNNLKLKPNSSNVAMAIAEVYARKDDTDTAMEWVKKAWDSNKGLQRAAERLTRYELSKGQPLEALSIANEFVAANSNNPEAHLLLGNVHLANRNSSNAIKSFQQAQKLAPDNIKVMGSLARAYQADGDLARANRALDALLRKSPSNLAGLLMKGKNLLKMEEYTQALDVAKSLREEHEIIPVGWELEGDIYYSMKKWDDARKSFAEAQKLVPSSGLAAKISQSYLRMGDSANAIAVLKDWVDENEKDPVALFSLASAYQSVDRKQEAIEMYRRLEEVSPNNVLGLNNLAWLLMEVGNKSAVDYADKLVDLGVKSPAIEDTIGWIYVQFDEVEKGHAILERISLDNPDMLDTRYHLAVAHHKMGETEKAKRVLGELIGLGQNFDSRTDALELMQSL